MRLIDADALLDEAMEEGAYGYVDAKQIADAPTIDAVQSEQRWIPVTERLPEDDSNCIVFSAGYVKESHFYFGKFYDPIEDYMRYEATHWMPLPEPPKRERKDDETDS